MSRWPSPLPAGVLSESRAAGQQVVYRRNEQLQTGPAVAGDQDGMELEEGAADEHAVRLGWGGGWRRAGGRGGGPGLGVCVQRGAQARAGGSRVAASWDDKRPRPPTPAPSQEMAAYEPFIMGMLTNFDAREWEAAQPL